MWLMIDAVAAGDEVQEKVYLYTVKYLDESKLKGDKNIIC